MILFKGNQQYDISEKAFSMLTPEQQAEYTKHTKGEKPEKIKIPAEVEKILDAKKKMPKDKEEAEQLLKDTEDLFSLDLMTLGTIQGLLSIESANGEKDSIIEALITYKENIDAGQETK